MVVVDIRAVTVLLFFQHFRTAQEREHLLIIAVVLRTADADPLVISGAEYIIKWIGNFFSALRVLVSVLCGDQARAQRIDSRVMQSDGDFVSLAGFLSAVQSRTDAGRQSHGNLEISETVGRNHGSVAAVYRSSKHAASRHVTRHVEARRILFRTLFPVSQDLGENQLRKPLL